MAIAIKHLSITASTAARGASSQSRALAERQFVVGASNPMNGSVIIPYIRVRLELPIVNLAASEQG
jgi:hypothetical protein